MTNVFRAVRRCWVYLFGRRAGGVGVGDPLRPTITRADLHGSVLGEALAPYMDRPGFGIYVAPTLGVNFVEPWMVNDA